MRVSYSLLNQVAQGKLGNAIETYLGYESRIRSEAMQAGGAFHKAWEVETRATGSLPAVFGGRKLAAPKAEIKMAIRLNGDFTLSGIPDLIDGEDLYEYKTGKGNAQSYGGSAQHLVYKVLEPNLKRANYLCYNQHEDVVTSSVFHLTGSAYARGLRWVLTNAYILKLALEGLGYDTTSHESGTGKS